MRRLILILLLAFLCFPAMAQRGFSGPHFSPHFSGHFAPYRSGAYGSYSGYPLFWDSLYPDDYLAYGYPAAAQPPVIVMQQASAEQASSQRFAEPEPPLVLELRGDRYVRIGSDGAPTATDQLTVVPQSSEQSDDARGVSAAKVPSAILVFRDGRREEISDYTIADGVLYAQANYYADGAWNRKIELSSLNLPATVNENRARGVRFQLPTAANEVIVGP